jgi:TetR/AcrR family transcriptional regulator
MAKSPASARRLDPEATRASIVDAATRLFLERGVSDVSLSDVARAAGVTKSLIHHHFGSKERLWEEVKRGRFSEYVDRQQALFADGRPATELLRASVIEYFRFLQRNPDYLRLRSWMELEQDASCHDFETGLAREGIRRIREAQEQGLVRKELDPAHILVSFLSLAAHWFRFREAFCGWEGKSPDDPAIDDAYLDDMLAIFFRGVAAP